MTPRKSKRIRIGGVEIGDGIPVAVQSMTNTDTTDIPATVSQITALAAAGCDIIRAAVPSMEAARALCEIKKQISIPLVADVHFDYRLAIAAIEAGADKLRINPGNIGGADKLREVVRAAKAHGIPIRIGVNAGSLEDDLMREYGRHSAQALVKSAERHINFLEEIDFTNIVLSVKASNPALTFEANRLLAERFPYPLHIGVTEAGIPQTGILKSAAVIGGLLLSGIGDTIRVSLTADPLEEVKCAVALLKALGLKKGVNVISCPTCGRTEVDLIPLAEKVSQYCEGINKDITVAVMGCVVNGPGEAKDADIGIACGKGGGVLFKKGGPQGFYKETELYAALIGGIDTILGE